jgi:hypothetical protein
MRQRSASAAVNMRAGSRFGSGMGAMREPLRQRYASEEPAPRSKVLPLLLPCYVTEGNTMLLTGTLRLALRLGRYA